MKSDNEIKVIPGLQAIGDPFGIGESGYLWRNGKRFATVIWTRSLNGYDHVSVRPYGKRQLTDEEIERITRMFFEPEEAPTVEAERSLMTSTVHLWLEVTA